jgi:hypothetical protein
VTAIAKLADLLGELERKDTTVMELARGGRPQEPGTLYPGEYGIFDRQRRSQFYYHSHDGADHEAGHFHTVRLFTDRTVHLVAISMAQSGWPQALFTLNGWAIGDAWETPANLKRYVRRFCIGTGHGPALLVRFVNLLFEAFRFEIEELQDLKERTLRAYAETHPGTDPLQDRSLEVLSRIEIDVLARLAGLRSAGVARP